MCKTSIKYWHNTNFGVTKLPSLFLIMVQKSLYSASDGCVSGPNTLPKLKVKQNSTLQKFKNTVSNTLVF